MMVVTLVFRVTTEKISFISLFVTQLGFPLLVITLGAETTPLTKPCGRPRTTAHGTWSCVVAVPPMCPPLRYGHLSSR